MLTFPLFGKRVNAIGAAAGSENARVPNFYTAYIRTIKDISGF